MTTQDIKQITKKLAAAIWEVSIIRHGLFSPTKLTDILQKTIEPVLTQELARLKEEEYKLRLDSARLTDLLDWLSIYGDPCLRLTADGWFCDLVCDASLVLRSEKGSESPEVAAVQCKINLLQSPAYPYKTK